MSESAIDRAAEVPAPQEIADLLRSADFALDHSHTALIAFSDRKYLEAIGRECRRIERVRYLITATLEQLPPAVPLADDQMAKVGRVIGVVLDKRFGDGSQEAVDAAMNDWFGGAS